MAALPFFHHARMVSVVVRQAHAHPTPPRRHQHRALDANGPIHPDAAARRHALRLLPRVAAEAHLAPRPAGAQRPHAR